MEHTAMIAQTFKYRASPLFKSDFIGIIDDLLKRLIRN